VLQEHAVSARKLRSLPPYACVMALESLASPTRALLGATEIGGWAYGLGVRAPLLAQLTAAAGQPLNFADARAGHASTRALGSFSLWAMVITS